MQGTEAPSLQQEMRSDHVTYAKWPKYPHCTLASITAISKPATPNSSWLCPFHRRQSFVTSFWSRLVENCPHRGLSSCAKLHVLVSESHPKKLTLLLCRIMSEDLSCKISSCFCAYSICIWHPLCCPCRMSCSPWNRVCFIFYVLHMFLNQIACSTKISKMWCRFDKQSLDKQSRTPRKLPLCNQLYKPLLLIDFSLDARTKKQMQTKGQKEADSTSRWLAFWPQSVSRSLVQGAETCDSAL